MKEDALWLSGKAQIDETSALRVVVVECQSRAAARLSAPFSEDELINIRETAGNSTSKQLLGINVLFKWLGSSETLDRTPSRATLTPVTSRSGYTFPRFAW